MKRKLKPVEKLKEEAEEGIDLSKLPKMHEPTTDAIVDQVGICSNPILIRQRKSFACIVCHKRHPQKWEACQEITIVSVNRKS